MDIPARSIPAIHVIFTEDGIPRWFGPEPVKDSQPLDPEELRQVLPGIASEDALAASWRDILITHRKVGGNWVLRDVVATVAESPDPAEGAEISPLPAADLPADDPKSDGAG